MKYSKTIAFAIVAFLFLSVNSFSQQHQSQHKQEKKKPTIMLIGKGEMTYKCPMKKHNIFASKEGKCPECGMNMKKMSDKDKKKMHKMMKTHMAVDEKGEMINKEKAKHEHMMKEKQEHKERMGKMMKQCPENSKMMKQCPESSTMLLKGEGEMSHKCPMTDHKVFSSESGKCPECGMNMKKMSDKDKKMMEKMRKDHKVIKKK